MKKIKPELLAGAGNWSSLISAVNAGANSVYFGVKGLNMRNLADNFDPLELKKVMNFLHQNNKKGYLAVNVIVMNNELTKLEKILTKAKAAKVDAVILWDMAVFSLAKEIGLTIHLSTQASVANIKALAYFVSLGVKRVVLARECSLSDITRMIEFCDQQNVQCEIESFIHGAMCVSVSGRCFLSSLSFFKSANRGECIQPCRREFIIKDKEDEVEYQIGKDYILSPKDLCSIDFIDQLIDAGIHCFKIEGRKRSSEYVKVVTSVYRQAIDAFFANQLTQELKQDFKQQLKTVYNRGFSSGFYFGKPENAISRKLEHTHEKVYLGQVNKFYKKISVAEVFIHQGKIKKNDQLLIVGKKTPASVFVVDQLQHNHCFVEEVGKGHAVGVKLPFVAKPKDKVFHWIKNNC